MPIRILNSPEPLSALSRSKKCILAQSGASRLLNQELHLYCQRQITGRSFLIAGHRGSGKTTLVHDAFLQVWKESLFESTWLRPLLIPLHGPNLLPISDDAPDEPKPTPGGAPSELSGEERNGEKSRKSETQIALEQITLSVYQSLAKEISFQFRSRLLQESVMPSKWFELVDQFAIEPGEGPPELGRWQRLRHRLGSSKRQELLELAAQLEAELYECPDPARLRDLWRRAGLLGQGVLFASGAGRVPDQGMRELVALASACEAYRRISGTYTRKETQEEAGKAQTQMSITLGGSGNDLFGPLLALLLGGLVGVGVFAGDAGAVPSALVGIASAIGAAAVLKHSFSSSHDRSRSRESTFLFDLSAATLDRLLPFLIDRFRKAGLAPVFIVDELDKVDDLRTRIVGMVQHLKRFVSEDAFFCFLTDRAYFEAWKQLGDEAAYPVEYTYFSHQLYVLFSPRDLHQYLNTVLQRPQQEGSPQGAPGSTHGDQQALALSEAERRIADDLADYPVLPYVLLHRARMHPIDLRRELVVLRGEDGTVSLPPGRVRTSRAFRVDLVIQIAIEMLLDEEDLVEEMDCHPTFRRLAHDALYYLSRKWQSGEDLDLREKARGEFEKYLVDRMGKEVRGPAKGKPVRLPEGDVNLLYDKVRQLADLLSDLRWSYAGALTRWKDLRQRTKQKPIERAVEDALGLGFAPEPILEHAAEKWRYRWCVDASGMPVESESPAVVIRPTPDAPDIWDNLDFIETVSEAISKIGGGNGTDKQDGGTIDFTTLSSHFRILSTTPAWTEAERSIAKLNTARQERKHYPGFDEDVKCVEAFAEMLRRSAGVLAGAFFSGAVLGNACPTESARGRLLLGLRAVSQQHRFVDMSETEVESSLEYLGKSLRSALSLPNEAGRIPTLQDERSVEDWKETVREMLDTAAKVDVFAVKPLQERKTAAWAAWHDRLRMPRVASMPLVSPSLDELFCAAANVSPANLMPPNVEDMGLVSWSAALLWALSDVTPDHPSHAPVWLLYPALRALGFPASSAASLLDRLLADEIPYKSRLLTEEKPNLSAWAPSEVERAEHPALLILKKGQGSPIEGWKPSSRVGAFTLNPESVTKLAKRWPAPLASLELFVPIHRIAVEIGAGDGAGRLHRALEKAASKRNLPLPLPPLHFHAETPVDSKDPGPVVRSLDELVALHQTTLLRPAPPS